MSTSRLLFFLFLTVVSSPALLFPGHHEASESSTPEAPEGAVEVPLYLRTAVKVGRFTPYAELEGRFEDVPIEFRYIHLMLGSYYRLSRHVKAGAFYQYQRGARHDDDWVQVESGWNWADTKDRGESVLILDVTPRFLMPFMPGENWLFMFKTRYLYNTYNSQQTLKLRPGISYFLMPARDPLLNFTFNWEFYLALNYSNSVLYSQWPYLEVLYHLSPVVKLSGSIGYRITNWSTSQDVIDNGEAPYEVQYKAITIGAAVNLNFNL
jgi:hypothetical protein